MKKNKGSGEQVKNSNRWAASFSYILAIGAVFGFYFAGEAGVDGMTNPQSLYIGFGIAAMFVLIAFFQVMGKKHSKT